LIEEYEHWLEIH